MRTVKKIIYFFSKKIDFPPAQQKFYVTQSGAFYVTKSGEQYVTTPQI